MKTVQMTLEAELVAQVDRTAKRMGVSRSGFTREALRGALAKIRAIELERRHRQGYARKPVRGREFAIWESEQEWGE